MDLLPETPFSGRDVEKEDLRHGFVGPVNQESLPIRGPLDGRISALPAGDRLRIASGGRAEHEVPVLDDADDERPVGRDRVAVRTHPNSFRRERARLSSRDVLDPESGAAP